jgi:hypothetical protein
MEELKVRKVGFGNFRVFFFFLIDPKVLGYTESIFWIFVHPCWVSGVYTWVDNRWASVAGSNMCIITLV